MFKLSIDSTISLYAHKTKQKYCYKLLIIALITHFVRCIERKHELAACLSRTHGMVQAQLNYVLLVFENENCPTIRLKFAKCVSSKNLGGSFQADLSLFFSKNRRGHIFRFDRTGVCVCTAEVQPSPHIMSACYNALKSQPKWIFNSFYFCLMLMHRLFSRIRMTVNGSVLIVNCVLK